jgi:hypothetical protein
MSFPGPVGGAANLACDTGLQRATDHFNFVVDNGGDVPAPTTPSNLQSPAAIIPDTIGNATLNLTPAGNNRGTINVGNNSGFPNVSAVVALASGGTGFSEVDIGGVALNTYGFTNTLTISQTGTPLNQVASFNASGNTVILGNAATAGTITMNGSTTISNGLAISDAAGGTNQLILSPLSATTSQIIQDPSGNGTLNLGTSANNPDIISLRDTTAANTGSVLIGGNGGNNILFTGSTNNAAATISTDRSPGNTGVLTIGGSVGAPAISFSDSGAAFLTNVQTAINSNLTLGGDLNMGTDGVIRNYANYVTAVNAALGIGASATITSTNPPPNGIGLYCVTIYAPSDITANVSGVAFWDGSVWRGGSTGNAAFRIQTAANFQSLTLFNTSATSMAGSYATNVYQILGPTTA